MAGPTTYDALVSAIVAAMEDDSDEFTAYIPTAIGLAEARLEKQVDTDGIVVTVTLATSTGDPFISKPTGYRFTRDLEIVVDGEVRTLKKKVNSFLRDYWPTPTSTSVPSLYADNDRSSWLVAPTPDDAYNILLTGGIRPTALSVGNQTNYYTNELPDALFYAAMSAQAEFMKSWSTLPVWEEKYLDAIKGVNNEGRRQRRDDDTDPNKSPSANNTLMDGDK